MSAHESALVVLVPEAEELVRPFRERHDPSAAMGMPAHVTLLYPFRAPDDIGPATLAELAACVQRFSPFRFSLAQTGRFPGVLYLGPEPDRPFRDLTVAIWKRYPDYPPYGGRHSDIVPHLSVASLADERELAAVAEDFSRASAGRLPVEAAVHDVALMEHRGERWTLRTAFRLGARN